MKLRNKITGQIVDLSKKGLIRSGNDDLIHIYATSHNDNVGYRSLSDLNEEWEDYEEPKYSYCWIDIDGEIEETTSIEDDTVKSMQEIGNYFETREEVEKTVEKLKAWKRLRDKGFRFSGFGIGFDDPHLTVFLVRDWGKFIPKEMWEDEDLKLLFGADNE